MILVSLRTEWQEYEDGKTLVCDKRDGAITCQFCHDLHSSLIFSGLLQKDLFKERWSLAEESYFNKIIVTLLTEGLPSSFLFRPAA